MADRPEVILSGFADEAANQKTAEQQFAAFAGMGLKYYSVRFVDVGSGVKNVMQLNKSELKKLIKLQDEYGLKVSSLGSPLGKVKLLNVKDGTKNKFVPFKTYLKNDVQKACELAQKLGTKLIRGFSFYHPRDEDPKKHVSLVVDQLGQMADVCKKHKLVYGIEIEANLVGQNGKLMAQLHRQVNRDNALLIFDAGNIVCQGYTSDETFAQYKQMKKGLGWLHIKDYRHAKAIKQQGHVDEEALKHFVPSHIGDGAHERILRDLRNEIPKLERKLKKFGVPGVFLDLEPHVKGGGQFGGFSGPDGFGVALRGLCRVLDFADIGYQLRDFDDIRATRGF